MSTLDTPAGTIHVEQPWVLNVSVAACAAVGVNVNATNADADTAATTAPTDRRELSPAASWFAIAFTAASYSGGVARQRRR
jgi:hypothetical protein